MAEAVYANETVSDHTDIFHLRMTEHLHIGCAGKKIMLGQRPWSNP